MPYLTLKKEIRSVISEYTHAQTLWIDTEVADYNSRSPKLSLIQVLDDPTDLTGNRTYILDVLEHADVVADFIEQIMINPAIEKVFHNASYDLKNLGNKKAKNITCTMEMAKKIPYYILPLPNYQLKTLVTELCHFHHVDKTEQTSDWGQRPLTEEQIEYAEFDCIYLAQVYLRLVELEQKSNPEPTTEDLIVLSARYTQLEQQHKLLNSEFDHLQERIKKAMQAQNISETSDFKLSSYTRTTSKVPFVELAKLVQSQGINLDFPITLTQKLQKELGDNIEKLPVDTEKNISWRLTMKNQESNVEDE